MPAAGPLAAMPIALKDNIVTIQAPTTCGSRILEGYVSPYDATAVQRLRRRGRHDGGEDEHGRVRHGFVHRALRLWPREAPDRPEPGARRLLRRLGGARGRRSRAGRARLRDRRLRASAGELLRRGGREAELWAGQPVRSGGVRLLARLHLGVRPNRRRRRAGAQRHERPRPARQHHARPSADGGADGAAGSQGSPYRPTARILPAGSPPGCGGGHGAHQAGDPRSRRRAGGGIAPQLEVRGADLLHRGAGRGGGESRPL